MKRIALLLLLVAPGGLVAQEKHDEQFYRPGSFNWKFLHAYPEAARLFNAFDYGHAVLYETLWSRPDAPAELLETERFTYLTNDLLRRPPRFAVAEEAVAPTYARLAWRAMLMFDRAHVLHRQIYDVYSDERLSDSGRIALVERLTDWYLADEEYALASTPKAMELMDGQPYSQVFRKGYPRFNGLIWAYHWLQVGLYDALLAESSPTGRQRRVALAVGRFWQMVDADLEGLPHLMPMTASAAPRFARRYPEAAAVFDNLHALHDVVSDVLATDSMPPRRKRAELLRIAAEYRDPERATVPAEEWFAMAANMGSENQGGPAVGFGDALPRATVRRGAPHHEAMGH